MFKKNQEKRCQQEKVEQESRIFLQQEPAKGGVEAGEGLCQADE